uniref:Uncharacterized protein n=1 Tax=Globodera rostochiensis TaxID=31243 RepID=A0A914HTE1_GLORO
MRRLCSNNLTKMPQFVGGIGNFPKTSVTHTHLVNSSTNLARAFIFDLDKNRYSKYTRTKGQIEFVKTRLP